MPIDLKQGFRFGAFTAEPLKGRLIDDDLQSHHLPPKAMDVLIRLAEAAPETLTREELIDQVWGGRYVSDEVLTHAITELRHALGDAPSKPEYIQTIPKRGYRLLKRASPVDKTVQSQARTDRRPDADREPSVEFGALRQRSGIFSLLLLGGLVAAPIAFFATRSEEADEVSNPSRGITTDREDQSKSPSETAQAARHSEVSELVLQAASLERRVTREGAEQAEILLEEAVSLDPTSVAAWSLLGQIYYRQTRLFRSRPVPEGSELARQAAQRALIMNARYGPAHATLALVNMTFDFDFEVAFRHLRQAQDFSPTDPYVLRVVARMEMTHAHIDHAIDVLERAVRMDPDSCLAHASLGQAYYFADRLDDAEQALQRSLYLNPGITRSRYLLGLVSLRKDSAESALRLMDEEPDEGLRMLGIAVVRYYMNDVVSSEEALQRSRQLPNGPRPYDVATAYAFRGQYEDALDWLELAYDQRDDGVILLLVDPLLEGLRSEVRWDRLIEKIGLPPAI